MEEQLINDAPFTSEGGSSNKGIKPSGISQKSWDMYNHFYNYARDKGDLHPEVFASQAALESNWFNKTNGKNNYFGKQALKTEPHTKIGNTKYRDYNNLDDALLERFDKYSTKYQDLPTSREVINKLSNYPSNKNYNIELNGLMDSLNINLDTPKNQYEEPIAEEPVNNVEQQFAPEQIQQDIPQEQVDQSISQEQTNIPDFSQQEFNYNTDQKANTDNNLELANNNSVKNLKTNNPTREYAEGGPIDPPTRKDSLAVLNSSLNFKKAITKLKYKKKRDANYDDTDPYKLYNFKDGEIKLNVRSAQDLKDLKKIFNFRKNGDVYMNSNHNRTGSKKYADHELNPGIDKVGYNHPVLKKVAPHQYLTVDQSADLGYNTDIPTILMDGRIKPQRTAEYTLDQKDRYEDYVIFNEYDPLAITPFDMLSDSQKKERVKKYGKEGVPKSFIDGKTPKNIRTVIKPRVNPKLTAVNDLDSKDLEKPDNVINSDVNIIPSRKIPKSFKVIETEANPYGLDDRLGSPNITTYEVNDVNNISNKKINGKRQIQAQYAEGGPIDPPIKAKGLSPAQQTEAEADAVFTNNWNANRVVNGIKLPKGYQIPSNQPVILSDLNTNKKEGEGIDRGAYNRKSGEILLDPSFQEEYGIPAHEYAHRFQDKTKLMRPKLYNDYIRNPIESLAPNTETYQSDPNEIHSELMRLRRNANFKPDQVIIPEDVENLDMNNYNFNAVKDKDTLIKLLNSTASINNKTSQNIAAYGGSLGKSNSVSNDLNEFRTGGTHEQNPLGGIPQGQSSNGKMNTVEQGETSHMIDGKKFIFSNRIII